MKFKNKLYTHEWLSVLAIAGLMGLLTLLSQINPSNPDNDLPRFVINPQITVFVEGEVENPGRYELKRGSKVKDLMQQITLLPTADTRKVRPEAKLRDGQVIRVAKKRIPKKQKGA